MKHINWSIPLLVFGVTSVGFVFYNVVTDQLHKAALDACVLALIVLILLAMAASR